MHSIEITDTANMSLESAITLLFDHPKAALLGVAAVGGASYCLLYVTYNIFFHPLAHIPGPRLAAATYLPEFFYDVLGSGLYTKQIQRMHHKYGMFIDANDCLAVADEFQGPIVRINPHEVHCADRHFIEEIYAVGNRKRDKPLHQVRGSGV